MTLLPQKMAIVKILKWLSARGRRRESIVEVFPASTAIMSKSESPKEPEQLR